MLGESAKQDRMQIIKAVIDVAVRGIDIEKDAADWQEIVGCLEDVLDIENMLGGAKVRYYIEGPRNRHLGGQIVRILRAGVEGVERAILSYAR